MVMKPNPNCQNSHCQKRQEEYQVDVCSTFTFTYIICFNSRGRRNLQLLKWKKCLLKILFMKATNGVSHIVLLL